MKTKPVVALLATIAILSTAAAPASVAPAYAAADGLTETLMVVAGADGDTPCFGRAGARGTVCRPAEATESATDRGRSSHPTDSTSGT